jgi:hypothetical protein
MKEKAEAYARIEWATNKTATSFRCYHRYGDLESCLFALPSFVLPPNHLPGDDKRLAADLRRESFGAVAAGGVVAAGCEAQYWCGSEPLG